MNNTKALKKNNLISVIRAVTLNNDLITKPEIARQTGLTIASVSNFINELIDRNIIIEKGYDISSGGRKASLFCLNSTVYYLIAAYISLDKIQFSVYDLALNVVVDDVINYSISETSVENGIETIVTGIKKIIQNSKIDKNFFVGIGITVPGPVNFKSGCINQLVNAPKWTNVPLKNNIESKTGITTFVDKDINGMLHYIKWKERLVENGTIVVLSITDGVGAGVVIGNNIYRGNHYIAGEIGHTCIDLEGGVCNCGKRGCIELYITKENILKVANRNLTEKYNSVNNIILIAANGNKTCKDIIDKAKYGIYLCLDNIIMAYDPDEIIINCEWLIDSPNIFSDIMNMIFDNNRLAKRSEINIRLNANKKIIIQGAAMLPYEQLFGSYETSIFVNENKSSRNFY